MSDLTPERLAELRELAGAATPGPWFFDGYSRIASTAKGAAYDDIEFPECEVPAWKTSCDEPRGSCHGCPFFEREYVLDPVVAFVRPHHGDTAVGQRVDDAEFIAAVSSDVVSALVDEIERLRRSRRITAESLREQADELDQSLRSPHMAAECMRELADELDPPPGGLVPPWEPEPIVIDEPEAPTQADFDMAAKVRGEDQVVDLMAALEESVAAAKEARSRRPQGRAGG
jgi:hypothetical protein